MKEDISALHWPNILCRNSSISTFFQEKTKFWRSACNRGLWEIIFSNTKTKNQDIYLKSNTAQLFLYKEHLNDIWSFPTYLGMTDIHRFFAWHMVKAP